MEARRVSEGKPSVSEEAPPTPPLARRPRLRVGLPWSLALLLAGCGGTSTHSTPPAERTTAPLTWVEKDIEHEGLNISLGHRSQEPIAIITRDGQPVANAMVFCTRLSAEGKPIGEEAATIYEPPVAKDPGLYSAGKLQLAADSSQSRLRFRIVLPDTEPELTRDIEIPPK